MACNALVQPTMPAALAIQPAANPVASCVASPAVGPVTIWPTYSNFYRQALSN